jgi:hypothetical protein
LLWLIQEPEGDGAVSADKGRSDGSTTGHANEASTATSAAAIPTGPPDQATLDGLELCLEPVVEIGHPTAVIQHPGTDDLYVSGVEGPIMRVPADGSSPVTVADFGDRISTRGESGLLDVAFNAAGDLIYVSLVESDGDLALVEIPSRLVSWPPTEPDRC